MPALAWTHASAFGGAVVDRVRGAEADVRSDDVSRRVRVARRAAAVVVLSLSFVAVVMAWMRRALYAGSDGRSMLVVKRRSLLGGLGPAAVLFAVLVFTGPLVLLAGLWVAIAVSSRAVLYWATAIVTGVSWVVIVWTLLGAVLILVGSLRRGVGVSPVGEETPDGERWVVESFAARAAADGASAFLLAGRTLKALPPGRVLVAVARTTSLQDGYVRLGFERGKQNRVFRRT